MNLAKSNTHLMAVLILLMLAFAGVASARELRIPLAEYRDKVYASWLAQCIGNVYGLPHENAYIEQPGPEKFPYGYGRNLRRLQSVNGAFSDDDTDIEYMYLLAMEKHGAEPTLAQLAAFWKHHVRDSVWLANRAALAAMHFGFTPPETGARRNNPHWYQIDPQLINEIWAVTAPGMVGYAARKSAWAARIMADDWGIEPAMHYGAMYSAAFFERDVVKLIDIGTAALPKDSRFGPVVEHMKALYRKYPGDWKRARAEMAQKYYFEEPPDTRTIWNAILNGAAGILALLYGQGDFQKTLDLSCAMGFDADNQAATMSGLLGIIGGSKSLPKELLFPLPALGWKEPFNDLYKNVTRHDMPDASLKDMTARMAAIGERLVLQHGGRKATVDGVEYLIIDADATFVPPLELPSGPGPHLMVGQPASYQIPLFGGIPPYRWSQVAGALPPGLRFRNGRITGKPQAAGVYSIRVRVESAHGKAEREYKLAVRGPNLAASARRILARLERTNTAKRDAMWLTVARSLYADTVEVIRDGNRLGTGSTFYSIGGETGETVDFYGYEWSKPVEIGLLSYHTGSMEENGGWFTSLGVEYLDARGTWTPIKNLVVNRPVVPGAQPYDKPHFVEYLLAFDAVQTTAIRIIGKAGSIKHWRSEPIPFTSITELGVYGPLPGYQGLQ